MCIVRSSGVQYSPHLSEQVYGATSLVLYPHSLPPAPPTVQSRLCKCDTSSISAVNSTSPQAYCVIQLSIFFSFCGYSIHYSFFFVSLAHTPRGIYPMPVLNVIIILNPY